MAIFVLNLIRNEDQKSFRAICSLLGEGVGLNSGMRRFEHEREMMNALNDIGIPTERYDSAVKLALCGMQGTIELSQNEAQKLGVLQTDSSE
jgi:hypothetical protein